MFDLGRFHEFTRNPGFIHDSLRIFGHSPVLLEAMTNHNEEKRRTVSRSTTQIDYRSGFTLIEIAIVFLVVGLLAGGIMAGQALLQASRDRNVAKQFQEYANAALLFKNKYECIPGDCANATELGLGGNGDGDGLIFSSYAVPGYREAYQFWQHLGNAELIQGKYSGTWSWADGLYYQVNGTNGPLVKGEDPKWGFWASPSPYHLYAGGSVKPRPGGLYIMITRFSTSWDQPLVMPPWRAQQLDAKMDDGLPFTGKVVHSGHTVCIGAGWPTSNAYMVNTYNASKVCTINFTILEY